jgi:hypothetical protein
MSDTIYNDDVVCSFVEFKRKLNKHKFIFSYNGIVSHAIVKSVLAMAEKKIDGLSEETLLKRKIFSVMVNCLQTICAEDKSEDSKNKSIFVISKSADGFTVYTGRSFAENDVKILKVIIDNINEMSHETLVDFHRDKLSELKIMPEAYNIDETILSLIDIAKKSNQRINYKAEPVGDMQSFLSLQINIR